MLEGGSRSDAARIDGVTLQIVRDWVLRFNDDGTDGLATRKAPGPETILDDSHRQALEEIIDAGPIPAVHGVVRWLIIDLVQWLWDEFRVSVSKQAPGMNCAPWATASFRPGRVVRASGLRTLPLLKAFPTRLAQIRKGLPAGSMIEIWWQDEARIGQKTQITRRWAKRGTRPVAPRDLRRASAWIFDAICPAKGRGAALAMHRCNSEAMDMHLAEINSQVAAGAHAVLLLDKAGWHLSGKLTIPPNITLLPLPPKCPELNPVEHVWQFMREIGSRTAFSSYDNVVNHCCPAWNKLVDQTWPIMSIGLREWAHGF